MAVSELEKNRLWSIAFILTTRYYHTVCGWWQGYLKRLPLLCCFAACNAVVDLAFIVDSSGSIGRSRWPKMLNLLKEVINTFNVGPDGTHVAVVAYSTRPVLEFTCSSAIFRALSM